MVDKKEGQHPDEQGVPGAEEGQVRSPKEFGDQYEGKDPYELAKMHHELESKLGEYSKQVKQYEEENQAYKNLYNQHMSQQMNQPRQPNQQQGSYEQPQGDTGGGVDFWSNPEEASKKVFQQNLSQYDRGRRTSDAMRYAPMAERMAVAQSPEVFEDVDMNQVRQNLYGGLQSGIIAPELVSNPETWIRTAWLLKGDKSGYKLPKEKKGSTPTDLEKPDATKKQASGPEDILPNNETTKSLMKAFNMTRKEAIETIQAERKERGEI